MFRRRIPIMAASHLVRGPLVSWKRSAWASRIWISRFLSSDVRLHDSSVKKSTGTTTASATKIPPQKLYDLSQFTNDRIRNFCIIAHIDHGKSTLADRLLEITKTITAGIGNNFNRQVLDKLKVERERGITVKAQSASMFYEHNGQLYLLNLIDTPGHVDFTYEVTRSMAACQGAILLVDATQGIQAQTLANFFLALDNDLTVVPIVNKVDLPSAEPEKIAKQIQTALGLDVDNILQISAKTGLNVDTILPRIIEAIPNPVGSRESSLRALLFDSWFDEYRGVICLVNVVEGVMKKGDKIVSAATDAKYDILEMGIMHPDQVPTDTLYAGQVGYIAVGMKSAKEAHIGDTFFHLKKPVAPLPGFRPAKPMLFAGIFPSDMEELEKLSDALDRLTLNDNSVTIHKETSTALGQGWRIGFLGMLHMDVFIQRLEQDYEATVIATSPTVPYKIIHENGKQEIIKNPAEFPDDGDSHRYHFEEPTIKATLVFPQDYLGSMITACEGRRGQQLEMKYLDDTRVLMRYTLPLAEVVTNFYDEIKSLSAGYVSFDYEESDYQKASLSKLNILLNGKPVDALSAIVHREHAVSIGKDLVHRLKSSIPKQLYEVTIQATIGVGANKILARETISALRKNVTARCYGGDVTRKMKLLEKQKEGKKRMKMIGNVELPHSALMDIMRKKTSNS